MPKLGTRILRWLVAFILVQPGFSQDDWHFTGPDIAQGKVAHQGPETFLQYYPELAVDGVIDTNIEHNHCSHTGDSNNAWWSVELGKPFVVKGIRIYNRSNNQGRLKDFRVVGNPGDVELYNDGKADVPRYLDIVIEITVDIKTAFDEIDIEIPGPYLTLCEVQVYEELCPLPQLPASSSLQYRVVGDIVSSKFISKGSYLLFHCEPRIQYELIGSANLTCLANGSYTDQLPRCEHYCSGLPSVVNGNYTNVKGSYIIGDFLWVTCDTNFAPRSDSKQTCIDIITWSNPSPSCAVVTCSNPGQLPNGHYVLSSGSDFPFDGVSIGTVISVVCDTEGFVPTYSTRTCTSDGSWTGIGQCLKAKDINCSLETLRPAERFYVLDKPYGSSIVYNQSINAHCELGYKTTSGDESRICLANGTLSGTELLCNVTMCSTETLLPRVRFYFFDVNYGPAVDYTTQITTACRPGYMWSRGNFTRTCLTNESFSGTELICSNKTTTCSTETLHPKDRFYFFDDNYGSSVDYNTTITTSCRPGYVWNSGNFTRTCLTNGSFSGAELLCSHNTTTCSTETLHPKDRFYFFDDNYGSSVDYNTTITTSCRPGYVWNSGNFTRTCLTNGSFSGAELLCSHNTSTCTTETLHPKDRFYFFDDNYGHDVGYNATITTDCRPGYLWSSGNFTRTCLTNGSFSGTELLCSKNNGPPAADKGSPSWAVGFYVGVPELVVFILVVVAIFYCKRSQVRHEPKEEPGISQNGEGQSGGSNVDDNARASDGDAHTILLRESPRNPHKGPGQQSRVDYGATGRTEPSEEETTFNEDMNVPLISVKTVD